MDTRRPPVAGRGAWLVVALGLVTALVAAVITRSPYGAAIVLIYAAATFPGLPIGRLLFGRHPAGVIAGAVIGYGLSAFAVWAVVRAGVPSAPAFGLAWAAVTAVTWALGRRRHQPLVELPAWKRADTLALIALFALVLVLMAVPYRKLGSVDAAGNRLYRSYFTADFIWHMSLTAELAKYDMPPMNPYLRGPRMHYYWTYFMVPAAVVGSGPRAIADVEQVLKVNALCTALLFGGMIFLLAWASIRGTWAAAGGVALALLASSAEGLYALSDVYRRALPIASLRSLNVDAVSSWRFRGLRVDSLLRSMWYNPQHSMACALGLVALLIGGTAGAAAPPGAVLVSGVALGLAAAFNPFVGVVFAFTYGAVVLLDALRDPPTLFGTLARQLPAALLLALGLSWCVANDMLEGAGGAILVGYGGPAAHAPVITLLLSLGPVLVPAVLGLWPLRRLPRALWGPIICGATALVLMYLVRLGVDVFWVGFRTGQLFLVTVPALIARLFAGLAVSPIGRTTAAAVFVVAMAAGLPTTLIDLYNVQDTDNRAPGPGFRWTLVVTPEEQAALRWIRRFTPPKAIVQMEPVVRGREGWSQIPTFGERRMAGGLPLPLLNTPAYDERMRRVQAIYATPDAAVAWREARRLGIDYLYAGRAERDAYAGPGIEKFSTSPEHFIAVFSNSEVQVYAVLP